MNSLENLGDCKKHNVPIILSSYGPLCIKCREEGNGRELKGSSKSTTFIGYNKKDETS